MGDFVGFVQSHKPYFEAVQALSSIGSLLLLLIGFGFLMNAIRLGRISSVSIGPFNVQMKQEAVEAVAVAARSWAGQQGGKINVARIQETVGRAFRPENADRTAGKSITMG